MRTVVATALVVMLATAASSQQEPGPQNINANPNEAFFLSAASVTAYRAKLQDVAYANITVVERVDATTANGTAYRLAVDRRRPPQRAATHANEGELWSIIDGSGEITTGGKIVETKTGATVNRTIVGGKVHKVSKGDYLLIPEGVPHQVTGFSPELVMVTFELPRGVKKP